MSHQELSEIVGPANHQNAGRSAVIDPIGANIAKEVLLNLAVLDGRDIERLRAALNGESFEGTNVEGLAWRRALRWLTEFGQMSIRFVEILNQN